MIPMERGRFHLSPGPGRGGEGGEEARRIGLPVGDVRVGIRRRPPLRGPDRRRRRWRDVRDRDRVVDVMEELYKFTMLTRDHRDYLVDRYSERRETDAKAVLNSAM